MVSDDLINEISSFDLFKDSLIKTAANHDFIIQPFILKNNGSFVYPNFMEIYQNVSKLKPSTKFKSDFRKGQEAEFSFKNLNIAKKHYLLCLRYSTRSSDSVKALNAIGRITVKLNEHEKAISYYRLVVLKYFDQVSEDGIPYVYFVIPQLLKISDSNNFDEIFTIIKYFIERLEAGLIPLNYNTEVLLRQVIKWSQEDSLTSPEDLSHISKLKRNISQNLKFTIEYKDDLLDVITKNGFNNHFNNDNDFKVINPSTGNNQRLLLINSNFNNSSGFLIDSEKLFDTIDKNELQSDLEFDYNIELPIGFISNTSGDNLIYISQLNLNFPGQMIQIKLKNENLINKIINRRRWMYGIATVLLLVTLIFGVTLTVRDIKREKNLARLRSDFISNVTHELKTPLTSIYMFTEMVLLKRVKNESDRDEYLSIILKESERLKRMINNILDYSKLEKGKEEYHFARSNLASIINATIHEMGYWFENDNFDITIELDENIYAKIDAEKIKQAISNLISNAFKYSIRNKKIDIRLYRKMNEICIEIEDHGIGIPENELSRIFEKFYRIDQKESISGTGLGLALVKEIVEAHGGNITVSSKIGIGSKFSITLNQQKEKV